MNPPGIACDINRKPLRRHDLYDGASLYVWFEYPQLWVRFIVNDVGNLTAHAVEENKGGMSLLLRYEPERDCWL